MGALRNLLSRLVPFPPHVPLSESHPDVLRVACENVDYIEARLQDEDASEEQRCMLDSTGWANTTEDFVAEKVNSLVRHPLWRGRSRMVRAQHDTEADGKTEKWTIVDEEYEGDNAHPEWTKEDMEFVRLATQREWNRRHPDVAVFEWRIGMEVEGLGRLDKDANDLMTLNHGIVVIVDDSGEEPVRHEVSQASREDIHSNTYLRKRRTLFARRAIDRLERDMGIATDTGDGDDGGHEAVTLSDEDRKRASLKIDYLVDGIGGVGVELWGEEVRRACQHEWNLRHPNAKIAEWGYYMRAPRGMGEWYDTTDSIVMFADGPQMHMLDRATGRDITASVHHIDFQWRKCLMAVEEAYRAIWEAHQDEIEVEEDADEDRWSRHTSKERIEDMHRIRSTILQVGAGKVSLTEEERKHLDEVRAALDEIWEEAGPMWTRLTTKHGDILFDWTKVDRDSPGHLMSQGICHGLHDYNCAIGMQFMVDPNLREWMRNKPDDDEIWKRWLHGTVEEDPVTGETVRFDMAYCIDTLDLVPAWW